jgi:HEPN domain-containing protein
MLPEKAEEVRAWLRKSAADLRGARVDLQAVPPLVEDALFHCQQAAEKAMKAFLVLHDVAARRTHDLDELGAACERLCPELGPVIEPARELTVYAWRFRYPGEPADPTVDEARVALSIAQGVHDAIVVKIPDDARPPSDLWGTIS